MKVYRHKRSRTQEAPTGALDALVVAARAAHPEAHRILPVWAPASSEPIMATVQMHRHGRSFAVRPGAQVQ